HCYGPYNHPHTRHACPSESKGSIIHSQICNFQYAVFYDCVFPLNSPEDN
ncbi:hypothetical protein L9F63_017619, partial [Diploptera punctata]